MKVIKLTNDNTAAVESLVKDSKNCLLTVGKAANLCIQKGLPAIRRKFVKSPQEKIKAACSAPGKET